MSRHAPLRTISAVCPNCGPSRIDILDEGAIVTFGPPRIDILDVADPSPNSCYATNGRCRQCSTYLECYYQNIEDIENLEWTHISDEVSEWLYGSPSPIQLSPLPDPPKGTDPGDRGEGATEG